MPLGSLIIPNTVILIAVAQKECNHPRGAESKLSCGASARRVECRRPHVGSSSLQAGTESDADGLESASNEANGGGDPQQPTRDQREASLYADGFTDLMLGGGILPSLRYQDPRYFAVFGSAHKRTEKRVKEARLCRTSDLVTNGSQTIPALAVISRQQSFLKATIRLPIGGPEWRSSISSWEAVGAWSAAWRKNFFCAN
jgi:hypothetical protein